MSTERIERCLFCGDATGKAGVGDGSLYVGTVGPFCEHCYDETGVEQERSDAAEHATNAKELLNRMQGAIHSAVSREQAGFSGTIPWRTVQSWIPLIKALEHASEPESAPIAATKRETWPGDAYVV
jgi:hypothetical protein